MDNTMPEPQVKKPNPSLMENVLNVGFCILFSPGIVYEYIKLAIEEKKFKQKQATNTST